MGVLEHTVELRADPSELQAAREFVRRWAEHCELPAGDAFRACLVTTEALSNAMRHGGAGRPIVLGCRLDGDDLVVEVTDRGRFRSDRQREGEQGGRGLFLIRELTRSFDLEARRDGTRLSMRLGAGAPALAASGFEAA